MLVWQYAMLLAGVPEALLPLREDEALKLYSIAMTCEPPPDFESIIMANALIHAAPLVLGVDDEDEKNDLLKLAYTVSRALIGDEMADKLKYPRYRYGAILFGARMQTRLNNAFDRILGGRFRRRRFNNFSYLMSAAAYDEAGISYRLPDHVYAEDSGRW